MDPTIQNNPQPGVQQPTDLGTMGLDNAAFTEALAEVLPLLRAAGESLIVTNKDGDKESGTVTTEELPEIDEADLKSLSADLAELEELIALLTLENEEKQAEEIKSRIEAKVKDLENKHAETLDKIKKTVELAVQQAKEAERNKIFGWVMTALSLVAAAISIVVTAGAATPLAVAACTLACVGAAVGLTTQILEETDTIKDLIEDKAKEMAKDPANHMTFAQAKAKIQKDYQIAMIVVQCTLALASISCGIAGMLKGASAAAQGAKAAADAASNTSKWAAFMAKLTAICKIAQPITQVLSLTGGAISTKFAFDALELMKESAEEEAQLQELKAMLDKIKEAIEEEQGAMQLLLEQIQDLFGTIAALLMDPIENGNDILEKTREMC